jgi:hypothetical protein
MAVKSCMTALFTLDFRGTQTLNHQTTFAVAPGEETAGKKKSKKRNRQDKVKEYGDTAIAEHPKKRIHQVDAGTCS